MKLTKFKIKNYRCLRQTDWIPLSQLTICTGENDGGKSSTIYALELFLTKNKMPTSDDFSFLPGDRESGETSQPETEIICEGIFDLNDSELDKLKASLQYEKSSVHIRRIFRISESTAPYEIYCSTHSDSTFHGRWPSYTIPELTEICTRFKIPVQGRATKPQLIDIIKTWLESQPKIDTFVEFSADLVQRLPTIEIFSSETALEPEREIRKVLTAQFQELLSDEKYSGRISDIEQEIKGDLNKALEQLGPFVKQYSRDVGKVSIRPEFNFANGLSATPLQLVRDDGRAVLLQQSGAGQRRRISLAVYEWTQKLFKERDNNSRQLIMAFDEPDTHLDYRAQRHIFDVIRKFSEMPAIQVVVCTHSLNFIERVPITQIIHYRLDAKTRFTNIEQLQTTDHETTELFMYEISKNLGLKNSVMLYERCFLAVEGPTEISALPILFYKQYGFPLQSAGICLLNCENQYGARMVTRFLQRNRRHILFLVDQDTTSSDIKKHFTKRSLIEDGINLSSQVFFAGTNELEDDFSDEVWVRVLNKHYRKPLGELWATDEIAGLRINKKFSKAIQDKVKGYLEFSPSKADLGHKIAQEIEISEIPVSIKSCLEAAYLAAN